MGITEKKQDLANMHIVYLYQNKERVLITVLISATPYTISSLLSASIFAGHDLPPGWRTQLSLLWRKIKCP